jgi:hypothetical protein
MNKVFLTWMAMFAAGIAVGLQQVLFARHSLRTVSNEKQNSRFAATLKTCGYPHVMHGGKIEIEN